jgi:hypothetical protein
MRNQSHTLISTFRDAVDQWRRRVGWSREAVVDAIVREHDAHDAGAITGIRFDSNPADTFESMKNNADRVFRWLDDVSKDRNLLPANFLPTILAALPLDLRLHCANALLRQGGLEARGSDDLEPASFDAARDLKSMTKESAEAQIAMIGLGEHSTIEELEAGLREVEEAREAHAQAARDIKAALAKKRAVSPPQLQAVA